MLRFVPLNNNPPLPPPAVQYNPAWWNLQPKHAMEGYAGRGTERATCELRYRPLPTGFHYKGVQRGNVEIFKISDIAGNHGQVVN